MGDNNQVELSSQVWQRYIKARNNIIKVLAEVPTVIATIHSRWEVYRNDTRLQNSMNTLFSILFDSLTKLIKIFVPPLEGIAACESNPNLNLLTCHVH